MDTQVLLESLSQHITLAPEETDYFVSLFKSRKIKKKQVVFQEGDTHNYVLFVTQGCLRSYAADKNGLEHVLQFAPEGWWISDMYSFITTQPGLLYIDAIEDSALLMITKSDLDQLYTSLPKMERFFRILAERSVATYQNRLINTLSLPALERYQSFCRLYPSLITRLPQKQVAAYIGVTPEFLSKILNQPASGR